MFDFTTLVENYLQVKEIFIALFFTAVAMLARPNFYTDILADTSDKYKSSDDNFECYDVYDMAVDRKGEHFRLPLVGAAIHVTLFMLAFAAGIWVMTDMIGSFTLAHDTSTVFWCMLRGCCEALGVLFLVKLSEWIFYSSCRSYIGFNSKVKEEPNNEP